MKVFVFTTNKDKLINEPLNVDIEKLGNFEQGEILCFDRLKKRECIHPNVKTFPIYSDDFKPYFILIDDSIFFDEQHYPLLKYLIPQNFSIYLTIHENSSTKSNVLETFDKLFKDKLSYIYRRHNENTPYDVVLKRGIENNITDLTKFENEALKHFPDPKRIFRTNLLHYCLGKGLIPEDIPEELATKINNQEVEFCSEIRKYLTKHKTDKTMNLLSEEFSETMKNFKNDLKITVTH